MSCPDSGLQLQHILNVSVGAEEWGQDFTCKECIVFKCCLFIFLGWVWYLGWLRRLPKSDKSGKYIVTMSCPDSGLQLQHILNASIGAEEWGQDFTCKECRDITNCNPDSSCAHVFWLELEEFYHYVALCNFGNLLLCWQQDIPCCKTMSPPSEIQFLITTQLAPQLSADLDNLPNSINADFAEIKPLDFLHM